MIKAQYEKLTRQARIRVQKIPDIVMKAQHAKIIESADELAKVVRSLPVGELSAENIEVLKALDNGSTIISESLYDNVLTAYQKTFALGSTVNRDFMIEAGLSSAKVDGIIVEVNRKLLSTTINRTYQDGYNFSQRIWRAGQATQNDIKKVLDLGIANNRDPFQVALDLQQYVADGKVKLLQSYGQLQRGTEEFALRIPDNVDWRCMRIVKTETYTSLRDTELMSGLANPGTTGLYDWKLTAGRAHWDCTCADLAEDSPYTADNIPSNPHPNCSCYIQARLRDQREFVADLERWVNGESVDYLDTWAEEYGYVR